MTRLPLLLGLLAMIALPAAASEELCRGYGPQAPRDISDRAGRNRQVWSPAPPPQDLRLCNMHVHAQAEHKGPGFSVPAGEDAANGWACGDTWRLSPTDLAPAAQRHFDGVAPGNTIEVHWVYTSCQVPPGAGLGACMSEACANPQLRVESQVFLLVNDPAARDFNDYAYRGHAVAGRAQPRTLPADTGTPVVFAGSTTGPAYDQSTCSPMQVTWSVRPECARLDINSLHDWAAGGNVFEEHEAHGVRPLVTAPDLLAPIP
ncbi:delta-class carbonic anhydrase [Roseivivax sediminis]|uniref:Cadmium carbonic anhydrase repeat-containing protein n=1 Tax=Roseivivax sediminis TaxID=936889 RepID=A0A1I2D4U9_9RHOB|nr:delta-class carbonic anhydrase [Roseivivax sediminis]SFE75531.1 Cadmium carbonic anhydrase repeat-containing protein [Roseivivax sediminis]